MRNLKFRHFFSRAFALFVTLTLLISGCGREVAGQPALPSATVFLPTSTATIQPTATPKPTTTPVPTNTPTPFVPRATIKIFSLGPLSGSFAGDGTSIKNSVELAVKQLAGPLNDLGYKVEFAAYDDQGDMMTSVAVSKKIIADPDILCGVGPYTSRSVNQVKEIFHQAKLGFISPSATAAFVTASGYPEVNRVIGRHDGQGAAGAQFAKEHGFSRIFVVSQSENYAQFNASSFQKEANHLGLEVVGNIRTDAKKDFRKLIESIQAANADLVYFSTLDSQQAGSFFREARAAGYTGTFLGNEGIASPILLEAAGPQLPDGGGMYYTTIGAPAAEYSNAANFINDFKAKYYGSEPQMFAAQAYDAAGICMKAIEEASKARHGEMPSRAEVAGAIRSLQDYKGITGVYNFNKYGDPDPAQYFVFQVVSTDPAAWDRNPLVTSFMISPPK